MNRASSWAPGRMPGGLWNPDMLAGLYYGWNVAGQLPGAQPADLAAQQGAAGTLLQQGAQASGANGDWRSVVQAAAAAASQLEISKLSGSQSARSAELPGDAPSAMPTASSGRAQTAPAPSVGKAHLPARSSKVAAFAFPV